MFKAVKDARRRMTETVLAKVGASERTQDENFDAHVHHFEVMVADMNECGAALNSYLTKQKAMMTDAEELAKSLARIFDYNLRLTDWPDVNCDLKQCHVADQYKAKMDILQNVVRSSASTVCSEHALDPLKAAIGMMAPEIDALVKERNVKLTDYDSYRRRLKEKEQKRDQLEAQGKAETPAAVELNAEIDKFQKKVASGLEEYTYLNTKTKADIINHRKMHDQLMDQFIVYTIVCQAELFNQAAQQLEHIIQTMPDDMVSEARRQIADYMKQGGVRPGPPPEKSTLMKTLDVFTGKALPSDFASKPAAGEGTGSSPTAATAVAVPVTADRSSTSKIAAPASAAAVAPPQQRGSVSVPRTIYEEDEEPKKSNPFGEEESNPFGGPSAPAPPSSALPPPPPARPAEGAGGANFVEALFDNVAEDEDELTFSVGDMIEVIDNSDSGWWRGRCHGKEGLFPANYVKQ